jgi:hypothetical protein
MSEVWICAGLKRPYRVASWAETFQEFDSAAEARAYLAGLLAARPELVERVPLELVWNA